MISDANAKVYVSHDVSLDFSLRIKALHGQLPHSYLSSTESEVFVTARLISNDEYLTAHVSTTVVMHFEGTTEWDEKLNFPIKVRDLPRNTLLELEVLSARCAPGSLLGRTRTPIFDDDSRLFQGLQSFILSEEEGMFENADALCAKFLEQQAKLQQLEGFLVQYEQGTLPAMSWLDNLVFSRIRDIRKMQAHISKTTDDFLRLSVELPVYAHPVVFHEVRKSGQHTHTEFYNWQRLTWLVDDEASLMLENPAERKHQKLSRSLGRGVVDMELKPDGAEKRRLSAIINLPPTRPLDIESQNLIWKFRFALRDDSRALTKFLKCVDWSDPVETKASVQLMHEWAPIGPATALELLSPTFTNVDVRCYAVSILNQADNEELLLYLLQLVQALRYEKDDQNELAKFLVSRGNADEAVGNYLYWYLQVGWDGQAAELSMSAFRLFEQTSRTKNKRGRNIWATLRFQQELMEKITAISEEVSNLRGARKVERLRTILSSDNAVGSMLSSFPQAVPNPLNPTIFTSGIVASESFVFKSALSPLKLSFQTITGDRTVMIFKKGDDLRQDQLCVQMISLMDKLLKAENLDLKLTSYRVLATGSDTGLIEFVKSQALADILKEHEKLTTYIALHNPDSHGPNGCTMESMMNFVKSCAGYSVMTYLLGVGDRHLDNLMLAPDGRLFHIDFGFIMGRDPKISPPSMKLCKEMIEAMGEYFNEFKMYCCEAYNILRKSESVVLLLNLFSLMADANIPDININQDYEKALLRFESKFALELDDEAARQHFISEIHRSSNALLDPLFERAHRVAQYLR